MKNAIILHGKPSRERYENPAEPKPHEANWLPWLGRQLSARGVTTTIPAFPKPYFPVYEEWQRVFETNDAGPETGLIGHSAGAEFILRWLSENQSKTIEQAVLVAPYRDYAGKYGEFSKYVLDARIQERIGKLTIINSLDDDESITKRAHELSSAFPDAQIIELNGYGHFRIGHNMQSEEFPVLLDLLAA
jgi:predicted alpha/beta hydrolase family esterase